MIQRSFAEAPLTRDMKALTAVRFGNDQHRYAALRRAGIVPKVWLEWLVEVAGCEPAALLVPKEVLHLLGCPVRPAW